MVSASRTEWVEKVGVGRLTCSWDECPLGFREPYPTDQRGGGWVSRLQSKSRLGWEADCLGREEYG